ncbi:MAG: hypothetical protein CMD31_00840 [Flavobacteriales bacterium]|nr:hypothetical protein [Flavobacteriales bacterium]|tara:strand:+ start:50671 stop:51084 length:414 start_codon:yes stop_codon:yes gene_type:complete
MFKKVAAIFLALFFLASSSHLSFATHFCGGHVFKHSFLLDTSDFGCGMEKDKDFPCEDHSQMTKKDCCDTQLIQYSIKDNFQTSKVEVNIKHATSLLNVVIILFSLPQNEEEFITYKTYKVPLPEKDIPVLFQSFLI